MFRVSLLTIVLAFIYLIFGGPQVVHAETIATCGSGWLEKIDGTLVLHLKGTPYEMGFQHGALLKSHVQKNLKTMLHEKAGGEVLIDVGPLKLAPKTAVEVIVQIQRPYVADRYWEELRGLAEGAEVSVKEVQVANFIPELFHCSGFALSKSATKDGKLLHGRVLDYAVDWGLQEHAVVIVAEPAGRLPWVNVSYAGFLGSVTGMNSQQLSIGEMGGGGLGRWGGRPMALIVREALETASNLDEAIAVFRDGPRTCQYYYVIADGRQKSAVGMEASWDVFQVIREGEAHPLLPKPVTDCVLLSAGSRYEELVKRTTAGHGQFDHASALGLMARPVAMSSNLHNVLFEPETGRFWVANASLDNKPAADQPYQRFSLPDLLGRHPTPDATAIPLIPAAD